MYIQYETEDHFIIVDHDKLNHPFGKSENVYRIRVGENVHNTTIKSSIEPYIIDNYGEIISKKIYK